MGVPVKRSSVSLASLVLLSALATTGSAQNCGFPWTVTATAAGAKSVAVSVCGSGSGCYPHNPQYTVQGSAIRVTFQTSEPPDGCQCLAVDWSFSSTVLVRPVEPGDYTVSVDLLSCGAPLPVGGTSVRLDAVSSIPALDWRGIVGVILLVGAAAVWRLRGSGA